MSGSRFCVRLASPCPTRFYLRQCRSTSKGLDSINLFVATWLPAPPLTSHGLPYRPRPSPGGPVMNTLFGSTPLAGIVELFNSPPVHNISYPWYPLSWAPLCQSLWIPVLFKNVIISCWQLQHEIFIRFGNTYGIHMGKFSRMRLFFLEGLKKEVLARVDMIFTSPLFGNSVFSIISYYKQLYKHYSKIKGLLLSTSERSAPWK